MKISTNWLKQYVNIPDSTDFHQLGELFTTRTAEVEEVYNLAQTFDKIVIGKILEILPHPNADKLQITKTDVGSASPNGEPLQIVCGASNIFVGQIVPVAMIGSKVRWHGEGDLVELKPTQIRGEDSAGMICAAEEIGLKDKVDGILDLSYLTKQYPELAKPGTPLAQALHKDGYIIDIDNKALTHRPDLWGHRGIAREIAAIYDLQLKPLEVHQEYPTGNPIIPVEIKSKQLCPRYLSTTIENIKVELSPEWLRNALESTGNRSINNIVDLTNFVMLELGNPLHAFDTAQIKEKLIIRTAKKGEKIETLDGETKELKTHMLIVADVEKPLAIAGVKGGMNSGITEQTTSITLEAANFNPVSVRKTSTEIGIRTEAVQRFEKDLDPLLAEQALDRFVKLLLEICPQAKIASPKLDVNYFKYKPRKVKLDIAKTCSKIGVEISAEDMAALLKKLEFKILKTSKKVLEVEIPSFRATKDVNHQDDLVEEIARLYGYEKIPSTLPTLHLKPAAPNTERQEKYSLRNILSLELGFHETVNYSFYSEKTLQKAKQNPAEHLKIKNYLSETQTHLRTSLLPNLLSCAAENLKNQDGFKLYELGRTYKFVNEFFPLEEKQIAGIIILDKKSAKSVEPFYQIKSAIDRLLERSGVNSLKYRRAEKSSSFAHPNKFAAWFDFKSNQEIIQIFELHPQIARNFELDKHRIACFTINYTLFHQLKRFETKFKAIRKFPGIEFDISALFPADQEIAQLEQLIKKSNQQLVQSVKLFDLYQGPNIPAGRKSLAFKITLQAADRTLTDQEMKDTQQKIFQSLQAQGAEIRGL
ncbi:MAG: phenylalanine--tRNA ligase subunit beta [Candidatus Altimarinota bacterium]